MDRSWLRPPNRRRRIVRLLARGMIAAVLVGLLTLLARNSPFSDPRLTLLSIAVTAVYALLAILYLTRSAAELAVAFRRDEGNLRSARGRSTLTWIAESQALLRIESPGAEITLSIDGATAAQIEPLLPEGGELEAGWIDLPAPFGGVELVSLRPAGRRERRAA